ncbi:hypothetical protein D3C77_555230 [compost metagenome]
MRQFLTGRGGLCRTGSGLRSQIADSGEVAIHFPGNLRLLLGSAGNYQVAFIDLGERGGNLVKGLPRRMGHFQRVARAGVTAFHRIDCQHRASFDGRDQLLDFLGRALGAVRQAANFIGNHGKTTTRFTRPGGFNRRVECQ